MDYPQFLMIGDYSTKRFVLHHCGARTLVVVGCNPSKASDLELDPTMHNVCRIANTNGYDGILMINLSAERTSNPEELSIENPIELHKENLSTISSILQEIKEFDVLLAYGGLIKNRRYLKENLQDLLTLFANYDTSIYAFGVNKDGTPKHPCPRTGLPRDISLKTYNIYNNGK